MPHFKDKDNAIFWLEAADVAAWRRPGWKAITDAEADQLRAAQMKPETVEEWRARAVVSRFQARAALHLAGLLPAVEALMQSPQADPLARLAWQDAQEFRRLSPTVAAMGAALGLKAEALDALFRQAAQIDA